MRRLIVLPLILVFLMACSHIPTEGTVTDKNYTEEYTVRGAISVGKVWIPTTTDIPESWSITVESCNPNSNKCRTTQLDVSEDVYNSVNIGDYYVIGK